MRRWLLLLFIAGLLLLVVSAAGDVLFVHHHLDSYSAGEHYSSSLLASLNDNPAALSRWYFVVGSFLALTLQFFVLDCHCMVRYFCGWYSSAYDAKMIPAVLLN